ncbi:hypothetical protein ACHAXR_012621 [Thalassiosira sp. AJA248-18]
MHRQMKTRCPMRCMLTTSCSSSRIECWQPRVKYKNAERRCHQLALPLSGTSNEREFDTTIETNCNLSPQIFVQEVVQFLDADGIPWKQFSQQELRQLLELYFEQSTKDNAPTLPNRVNEMMALLDDRLIIAVGGGEGARNETISSRTPDQSSDGSYQQPYSFILNLCPTPNLQEIQTMHQGYQHGLPVSQAVANYAWTNSHLTNAFYNHYPNNLYSSSGTNEPKKPMTIVHLHQDVWNRSPKIVTSRLRSKCGLFQQRIYGRQTIVKRITKPEYLAFLEENHLWGATGAKYGYGLFLKPKKSHTMKQENKLVAVATFSSKRKINRASHNFLSFELLRFCTSLDTTVVGGLTKLVAAFVKDLTGEKKSKLSKKANGTSEVDHVGIDIITSIDRDFGCNTWPNFEQMEVLNPVPMFVGDVDGIRRHAVGAGLTPLEQSESCRDMTTSQVLRAGLPDSLLRQLQEQPLYENPDGDTSPFTIAAQQGFHPVFDAGVERLMLVVASEKTEHLQPTKLWENSEPRFPKEHYSSNTGIANMIGCIRRAKNE